MTYVHPFLRLVVSGSLYTAETFSWGLSFIEQTTTPDAPDEVPPALLTALQTFWQGTSRISQYAQVTSVKLNLIGTDGRYANQETVEYEPTPPYKGSSSIAVAPQLSLVVSLGTAFRRGRAHAGRFYLPLPGEGPETDGRLHPNFASTTCAAAKAMLDAFNVALGPDWHLGVVSDLGAGSAHTVTTVRVGRVLDTLRSRRSSLAEDYATATLNQTAP